jgi:hypothetical protein
MHATYNALSENVRTQTTKLSRGTKVDLHGQLNQAHWNERGPTFVALHELPDRVAGEAETYPTCSPSGPRALAQLLKARSRSRPSVPSSSPILCAA